MAEVVGEPGLAQFSAGEGRWVAPDPAGMTAADITNPQTWNLYTYVNNMPCNAIDPLGLETCTLNIGINNKVGLTQPQLAELEARINAVFDPTNGTGIQFKRSSLSLGSLIFKSV
jgi:uncharacterized protein RhaS with RHS repeats